MTPAVGAHAPTCADVTFLRLPAAPAGLLSFQDLFVSAEPNASERFLADRK